MAAPDDIRPARAVGPARNATAGLVLSGASLALRDVVGTPVEDPPAALESAGDPPASRRVDLVLDPEDPSESQVLLREDR